MTNYQEKATRQWSDILQFLGYLFPWFGTALYEFELKEHEEQLRTLADDVTRRRGYYPGAPKPSNATREYRESFRSSR